MAKGTQEQSTISLNPAQMTGLFGFAVAQPVYDLLTRHPAFLTAHGFGARELLYLCLALSVLLPLLAWVASRLVGTIGPRTAKVSCLLSGFGLVLLFALPLPWWISPSLPTWWGIALAVAITGGLGWLFFYTRAGRLFLNLLAVAALVFPISFLLRSDVLGELGEFVSVGAAVTVERPADIVILVFDELPSTALANGGSAIDERHFPNFARLASRSTWYRSSTTNASLTEYAVPSMLSGKLPDTESWRKIHFSRLPENLFNLLSDSHRMHVHEPITRLCHPELCQETSVDWRAVIFDIGLICTHRIAPPGARDLLPSIDNRWGNFDMISVAGRAQKANRDGRFETLSAFISEIGSTGADRPTLHFFHSMLPHAPYHYLPSGHRLVRQRVTRGMDKVDGHTRWGSAPDVVDEARALFRLQLQAVDTLIGQLIDRLDDLDRFDETMIIVTADHGVSFRPGDLRRRVSDTNQWDIASVPLLIKYPLQTKGKADNTNAETIDVLPTIADTLGIELPWPVDGASLRRDPRTGRPGKHLVDVRTIMALAPTIPDTAFETWWPQEQRFDTAEHRPPAAMPACKNVSVELRNQQLLQKVVPETSVPAHLIGDLTRPMPDGEILVEMNGRVVAAGSRSLADDEFFAFVDERHFVRGKNRLRVLARDANQWCLLYPAADDADD